jgi:hypothetical protein
MELIDSIYLAAGLPARQPTPPQGHTTEPPTNGPLER